MCMAFVLSSCVKHELNNTEHPDKGALVVTADFSSRSAEANVPASYVISLASGDDWGNAATVEVQGETNVFGKLLDPTTYNMLVYNPCDDITVEGTTATVNTVQTKSRASNFEIVATPEYLFGFYKQISIAEDDTTWVVAKMKQYVKLLKISLNVKDGDYSRVDNIVCTIEGVAMSIDLSTGILGEYSSVISNTMELGNDSISTDFRVLGVVTSEKQILTITITYDNGDVDVIESDISDVIDKINDDDDDGGGSGDGGGSTTPDIDINADVNLPVEAGMSATISGWKEADDSVEAK